MSDYIKRDDAQDIIDEVLSDYLTDSERATLEDINAEIGETPTADVVEVRHGRWRDIGKDACQCSECDRLHLGNNAEQTAKLCKYCPNCGARMDGEKE